MLAAGRLPGTLLLFQAIERNCVTLAPASTPGLGLWLPWKWGIGHAREFSLATSQRPFDMGD